MEIALLTIQIATLVALIVYVIKTWEMASATKESAQAAERTLLEMKQARDQETAPYVIVFFDLTYARGSIHLVVKNIGRSIAENVRLSFEPLLQNSEGDNLEELPLFAKGIASLAPEQEIRAFLDGTVAFFNRPEIPLTYSVEITYHGGLRDEPRSTKHILDLSVHKDLMYIRIKDIHNLNETLEKLLNEQKGVGKSLERISRNLENGVFINNPALTISSISSNDEEWRTILFAKLQEFVMMWETVSDNEIQKKTERLNMQSRILLISGQILTLLSVRPGETQQTFITQVHDIAAEMQALSRRRIYAGDIVKCCGSPVPGWRPSVG
jgi:hypothetical protein